MSYSNLHRNDSMHVTGLIIAAGLSSRMGFFKPLLKFNDKSFLINILEKLDKVCNRIVVVTGYKSSEISNHIKKNKKNIETKIDLVCNIDYENGMFSSIKSGINEIKQSDWILYHMIDQPNLPQNYYIEFLKQIEPNLNWVQPSYNKKNGHPILFNSKVSNEIKKASNESNLREISKSNRIRKKYWDCNYEEIFTDIDTPHDLNNILSQE